MGACVWERGCPQIWPKNVKNTKRQEANLCIRGLSLGSPERTNGLPGLYCK